MPYATGNQLSIYYEVHGSNGSPLLMIMGWAATIAEWVPEQIKQLSQKHQVIIFDNRGAGQSDKPTTAYSMADFAADTVSVLDAMNVKKAHVLGVSMGGMIAQHVVLNYPGRVSGLVLGCTQAGLSGNPKVIPVPQDVHIEPTTPSSGEQVPNQEHLQANSSAYPGCSPEDQQRQYDAVKNSHDTFDMLATIRHPTLIQTGTADIVIHAENSRVMARLIPNAQLIEYENCGHGYLTESGEKGIIDILAFLDEVDSTERQ